MVDVEKLDNPQYYSVYLEINRQPMKLFYCRETVTCFRKIMLLKGLIKFVLKKRTIKTKKNKHKIMGNSSLIISGCYYIKNLQCYMYLFCRLIMKWCYTNRLKLENI
jgi:hypothetical protein